MKKNKPVEVSIKEVIIEENGEKRANHQMFIGKKMIGEVLEIASSKFEVKSGDTVISLVKTMDQGYEEVLKNWNLHN